MGSAGGGGAREKAWRASGLGYHHHECALKRSRVWCGRLEGARRCLCPLAQRAQRQARSKAPLRTARDGLACLRAREQVMSDVPKMRAHGAAHGPGVYLARCAGLACKYAHAAPTRPAARIEALPGPGSEEGDPGWPVAWEQGGWRCIGLCEVSGRLPA